MKNCFSYLFKSCRMNAFVVKYLHISKIISLDKFFRSAIPGLKGTTYVLTSQSPPVWPSFVSKWSKTISTLGFIVLKDPCYGSPNFNSCQEFWCWLSELQQGWLKFSLLPSIFFPVFSSVLHTCLIGSMITYSDLPWTVSVYVYCSSTITHSIPFHFQNCPNLDGHDMNVREMHLEL